MDDHIQLTFTKTSETTISYDIYFEGKVAGEITTQINNPQFLEDLFIERNHRRKGIGKFIINHFNIKILRCTTWNKVGISFYKALGFHEAEKDIYLITFKRH